MNTTLLIVLGIFAGLSLLIWLGTNILPRPFSPYMEKSPEIEETMPIPGDLPEPVDRFYRRIYGDRVPIIKSFILTGRGRLRFKGVTLPTRLCFIHQAGQG